MGITHRLRGEMEGIFNHWAKVRITDREVRKLISMAMAPNRETLAALNRDDREALSATFKNIEGDVYGYALSSPSQLLETTMGTVFGAYNAVTGYFQNVRWYRDGEAKFKSITDGTARQRAQAAFSLCGRFASHGGMTLS